MDPAAVLRSARRRSGLTQAALASSAGTSQAAISAYETGAKQPSVATFARLLDAAGARLEVRQAAAVPPEVLRRRALVLEEVLALAEALPSRHAPELCYPRLGGVR